MSWSTSSSIEVQAGIDVTSGLDVPNTANGCFNQHWNSRIGAVQSIEGTNVGAIQIPPQIIIADDIVGAIFGRSFMLH